MGSRYGFTGLILLEFVGLLMKGFLCVGIPELLIVAGIYNTKFPNLEKLVKKRKNQQSLIEGN